MAESRVLTQPNSLHLNMSADDRAVAGLIARLLLHFFATQDLPDGARKAMAEDWLADLREFGPDIVAQACGEWRQSNTRRPAIADIRLLCIAAQREYREQHVAEQTYLAAPDIAAGREARTRERERCHEQDRLEGRARANEWAQRHGYHDLDAYAAGERVHISEVYRRVIAETLAGSPIANAKVTIARQLGVTVPEYTSDEMAEGRRQLGLTSSEPRAAE